MDKQEKIQKENALEEIKEIFSQCIKCGMCKSLCPVFAVLREEHLSPRGHSSLALKKVFTDSFFQCSLCKLCEEKCPLKLKICDGILKAREVLSLEGKNLKQNKEMIEKVRKKGNPFGGEKSKEDKLYCC